MNELSQKKRIERFLRGRIAGNIDSFCIYQWIERCHFQGWWQMVLSLSSSVPPNSLDDHHHKRLEFLLQECRNNLSTNGITTDEAGAVNEKQIIDLLVNKLEYPAEEAERMFAHYLRGSKVTGFAFNGKMYQAKFHKDVFLKVVRMVLRDNPDKQERLFSLAGKKRKYFSRNPSDLSGIPEQIPGTDIYAEVNQNAESLYVLTRRVLRLYGLDKDLFSIAVIRRQAEGTSEPSTGDHE
jgi:hypothetical protein